MNNYEQKHQAILEAATRVFLQSGYLATNMEQIAKEARVSKQTIYKHCSSKEALFLEIIAKLTSRTTELSQQFLPDLDTASDLRSYLEEYAVHELESLMVPEVIRLRRLVIGEADRFPEVARSYYESGPMVGFQNLENILAHFANKGFISFSDLNQAAVNLNWLILAHHMNRVMFLGEDSIPTRQEIRDHSRQVVQFFLHGLNRH